MLDEETEGETGTGNIQENKHLSVALGDTLQLILLLDGVAVAATLGGVDELFRQALGDALDVAESGLAGANGEEGDGLVDTAEWGDIDGLATDGTGGSDTCGVFAGTAVDDGVNGDLDGVLVGHDVDNLKGVGDDADSHELLSVVAAVHHQRVGETLDDGALCLAKALDGISASAVGNVDGLADLDVVGEGNVPDLDILVGPLVEQLGAANLRRHVLGQHWVALDGLDFDFAVRHLRDSTGRPE